jgi:formylglycine-generating enzyme required for sulfatase activity
MSLHLDAGVAPIAGYTLVRRLGRGGFGEVWEASAPGGVHVALKFIRLESEAAEVEQRALKVICNIRHPHLLDVQFATRVADCLVIAMPLCDESLADRLKASPAGLPRDELIEYMEELARAVDFLNEPRHRGEDGSLVGVQHRDIKPLNIFLVGGSARLADFGLAKILDAASATHTGRMTVAYAPPEVPAGRMSRWSDQYSLAVTYVQLRTGRLPFVGENYLQILYAHINDPPNLSGLCEGERPVVARALAKQPEQRWPTCREFVRALIVAVREDDRRATAPVTAPATAPAPPAVAATRLPETQVPTPVPVEPAKRVTPLPPVVEPSREPIEPPKVITNSLGMKLVLIPAGEFLMGSPDSDTYARAHEKPQHRVRITQPFCLGATSVTQGQYRAVTGASPSHFKGSDDLPVEEVCWYDAIVFCNKLSEREGLKPFYQNGTGFRLGGEGYRLPTEAEWEYACRAGSQTRFSFGDDPASLGEYGWFDGNSGHKTHPVGQKRPNAWGLYDMHGNVWEWCDDWFEANYYANSPGADPLGPSEAADRVSRGGSWYNDPLYCRAATHGWRTPGKRYYDLGFRLARAPVQSWQEAEPGPVAAAPVPVPAEPPKPSTPRPVPVELTPVPAKPPKEITNTIGAKLVRSWRRLRSGRSGPKEITNTVGVKLVLIPAGEFLMGSPDSDEDSFDWEKPQHRVRIMQPFFLGATPVMQGQYRAVTGANPSCFKGSDDLPVEVVSWHDAIAFCNKLSEREGLRPFYQFGAGAQSGREGYRLPTEAEWEYACRAGSQTRFSFGDDEASLGEHAWFSGNSGDKTHPAGQKRPNGWGLYDMHGNVWEWCEDWYEDNYYVNSPGDDPLGPSQAAARVIRGGSWQNVSLSCRAANRRSLAPGNWSTGLGFRLARVQSGQ